MFPLTRYFSIASLVVFVAGFLFIFIRIRDLSLATLVELREQGNTTLTRTYSNALWLEHGDFIMSTSNMQADDIVSSPEFETLDADIRRLVADSTILKVAIYTPDGFLAYSSDFDHIGEYQNDTVGFIRALEGDSWSELAYQQDLDAFNGNLEAVDLIISYVPIEASNSNTLQSVIVVYDDVTPLLKTLTTRRTVMTLTFAMLLSILYIVLFFIIRYAENILRIHHSQVQISNRQLQNTNIDLNEANSRAEEATRLKSRFLSTMSHELRTPLNAIIGYSGIITSGISGHVDGKTLEMVQRIQDSGQYLLILINNILDISIIESGGITIAEDKTSVRDLLDTLSEQLQGLAYEKNLDFAIHVDANVPVYLMMDSARVKQILVNLLANAIKFTDKGTITLDVSWKSNLLVMSVLDTGIGIPPHAIDYIFDEFRQADETSTRVYEGTGLGLAIVRKFTESMNGTVTVQSDIGEGSIFTVKLPLKVA
ncbi:MAG: hypothetical protein Phog2KO_36590 [Phototrophicaceae bacterium]